MKYLQDIKENLTTSKDVLNSAISTSRTIRENGDSIIFLNSIEEMLSLSNKINNATLTLVNEAKNEILNKSEEI